MPDRATSFLETCTFPKLRREGSFSFPIRVVRVAGFDRPALLDYCVRIERGWTAFTLVHRFLDMLT